ncbi:hypothetical protein SDC9_68263 [bioreactor metagenome]|uniref:Uncharacterized protein n=1 Tax=bioreactor metagenome TaxID=1076179 RepID=A0A644Y5G5_9ZZZZ
MTEKNNITLALEHIAKTVPKEKQPQAIRLLFDIARKKAREKNKEVVGVDKLEGIEEAKTMKIDSENIDKEEKEKNYQGGEQSEKNSVTPKDQFHTITNIKQCISEAVEINMKPETVVGVFPVVLSTMDIEIALEAVTKFSEQIFSIEDVDKKLIITSSDLVPYSNKMFLEGVIEKQVKYTTAEEIKINKVIGSIKKVILKQPFKCVVELKFSREPKLGEKSCAKILPIKWFDSTELDNTMEGKGNSEQFSDEVYFNLEDMKISEFNRKLEATIMENSPEKFSTFDTLKENTVINFTLTILQRQQVFVGKPCEV